MHVTTEDRSRVVKELEQGIEHYDLVKAVGDLVGLYQRHNLTKQDIDLINAKLHKDGYLPNIDITGADADSKELMVRYADSKVRPARERVLSESNACSGYSSEGLINARGQEFGHPFESEQYSGLWGIPRSQCTLSDKWTSMGLVDRPSAPPNRFSF
jgi:hypothetical protein